MSSASVSSFDGEVIAEFENMFRARSYAQILVLGFVLVDS